MPEANSRKAAIESAMSISQDRFEQWRREREYSRNIEQGQHYLNTPPETSAPSKHSPSQLLQCHRKSYYRYHNAPKEDSPPRGIFWFGSNFEEEIAVPFLREAIAESGEYVRNSMWVDFTVKSGVGELRFRGETDPVFVDEKSRPLLLTEIKTTSGVERLDGPKEPHLAQAHAYMYGLSEKYDETVRDAVIIYGDRDQLSVRAFYVEFDPYFWRERVLQWAEQGTSYRLGELPPADPEREWECSYCSYRHRCGKSDERFKDWDTEGLLPGFEYPKEQIREYFQAREAEAIPPSIASRYPELVGEYEVASWTCPSCTNSIRWESTGDQSSEEESREVSQWEAPLCPFCKENRGVPVPLIDPVEVEGQ